MSVLFILNPVAGKGRAKEFIPIIEGVCREENIDFKIELTTKPGDGTIIAKQAVEEGYKRIISVGGDGTLNEVLNGVAGSDAALGVVPGGSGNDFARSLGVQGDGQGIVRSVINGYIKPVDLGICNGRYFINVASAGFDAEVVHYIEKVRKFFSGTAAYIAAALKTVFTFGGVQLKINIDDKVINDKTLLIAIANGRYYGGGMLPAPDADIEDGYFDVCHARTLWRPKIFVLLPKYIKGKHGDLKEVTFIRGKKVRLEADRPIPINLDGDSIVDSVVEFEMIEKGINIIFPRV